MNILRLSVTVFGLCLLALAIAAGLWATDWGSELQVAAAFLASMLVISALPIAVFLGLIGILFVVLRLLGGRRQ
jgi:hypothetical protein